MWLFALKDRAADRHHCDEYHRASKTLAFILFLFLVLILSLNHNYVFFFPLQVHTASPVNKLTLLVHFAAASCFLPDSFTRLTSSLAWSLRGVSLRWGGTKHRRSTEEMIYSCTMTYFVCQTGVLVRARHRSWTHQAFSARHIGALDSGYWCVCTEVTFWCLSNQLTR